MRHAFVLLTLASLNACTAGEMEAFEVLGNLFPLKYSPPFRLQVQGTVTAADGSPIAGADVKAEGFCREGCRETFIPTPIDDWRHSISSCRMRCTGIFASTTTNDSGRYSLTFSFSQTGAISCTEGSFSLNAGVEASAEGFLLSGLWYLSDPHIRCTEEMQTIDFQLKQKSP